MAPKTNFNYRFGTSNFPRVSVPEPLVRDLNLPTVVNLLIEDSEFIANAIAHRWNTERSEGVHVTGSKTAQSTVSQAWLFFLSDGFVQVKSEFLRCLSDLLFNPQVENVVRKVWAHQEFCRKIGHDSCVLLHISFKRFQPV